MKALLTTLNSKYIHTAISIRYLKHYYDAFAVDLNTRVDMMEFTINNALDEIIERIALAEYDLVAFSCYIWNIEQTLKIAETLKKIQPTLRIVLGGPEVSHETEVLMHAHSAIDYVLIGEGEESFMQFIKAIERKTDFTEVNGLYYRNPLGIQKTPYDIARNAIIAERLPFPYESFEGLEHKILYYETSRGCPYNCKYCLSSTFKGVRYFPLEKVKRDLMRFINEGVMQVKFVDRTFNADRQRALEIMKFIAENDNGYTNFHLEITASLLDTATLDFLRTVRRELFQFEVGVQSTNEETLGAIDRHIPFEKIKETCLQIKSYENIHLHLDLIAGLPHEGFDSFMRSMDDLFSIRPEKIQLGFLKLLKGAQLRLQAEEYGMVYRDYPPYEILKTNWLSYGEMVRLKHIESLIDHYYNSGKFMFTLTYLASCSGKTFSEIMKGFSDVWEQNQWFDDKHALVTLYKRLYAYGQNMPGVESNFFKELLRFDYLRYNRKKGDDFFTVDYPESFKNRCHAYLQDEAHIAALLPRFVGKPAKTIMKQVH
ncbi:MAG: B12-binding domain-containing radical SAM protein, partial [Clostridia bacterium]|nr:B12-binding domain-containing radical SAM protein [Clostridia bacterium]